MTRTDRHWQLLLLLVFRSMAWMFMHWNMKSDFHQAELAAEKQPVNAFLCLSGYSNKTTRDGKFIAHWGQPGKNCDLVWVKGYITHQISRGLQPFTIKHALLTITSTWGNFTTIVPQSWQESGTTGHHYCSVSALKFLLEPYMIFFSVNDTLHNRISTRLCSTQPFRLWYMVCYKQHSVLWGLLHTTQNNIPDLVRWCPKCKHRLC